jgi:fructose-1,6-bisphosphatase/inositol monophosphatase family enzyme
MLAIDHAAITDILREIGQTIILPRWRNLQAGDISQKTGPDDLVTIADQEAERALIPLLQAALPGSLVLGEESYAADPSLLHALRTEHPVWIIDPVDGTKPFAEGKETFGTIVALVQNDVILSGWIHHPVTQDTLVTERGSGAFWNSARCRITPAPRELASLQGIIGNSLRMRPHDPLLDSGIPIYQTPAFIAACHIYPAMMVSSSLFGLPPAPCPHFRATLSNSKPWDDAAGALAVREAGGELIASDGTPYRPTMFDNGTIVATDYATAITVRDWLVQHGQHLPAARS